MSDATKLKKTDVEEVYALSPMQSGLLFESVRADDDPYLQQFTWTLEGEINPQTMRAAWGVLIERHSILRTGFFWEAMKSPAQVVMRSAVVSDLPWTNHDISDLSEDLAKGEQTRIEKKAMAQTLDFARPPLMRVDLVALPSGRWHLIWTVHHLIVDGWSGGILTGELMAIYDSMSQGIRPNLAPAPRYRAYIDNLRERQSDGARKYWSDLLSGVSETTTPTLATPDREDTSGRGIHVATLSDPRKRKIQITAQRLRVTANAVCQAALGVVLSRYCETNDVVFGVIQADRPETLKGADRMVGPMISNLPCRLTLDDNMTVTDLVAIAQKQISHALEYAGQPGAALPSFTELDPGAPMSDVMYAFESFHVDGRSAGHTQALKLIDHSLRDGTNFPLTLLIHPDETWMIRLLYGRATFSETAIVEFADAFIAVLDTLCDSSEQSVGKIALGHDAFGMVSQVEVDTEVEIKTFLMHWQRQIEKRSDAPFLIDDDRVVSYAEADHRARQIAADLMQRTATTKRVGICAAPGADAILAAIGATLAGWAWVPLVNSLPAARLVELGAEVSPDVIFADPSTEEIWSDAPFEVIDIAKAMQGAPASELPVPEPEHPAVLLFTSGSTGIPKAVEIPHRAWSHHFSVVETSFKPPQGARVLQHVSYTFDAFLFDITTAVLTGGALICTPPELLGTSQALEAHMRDHKVDTAFLGVTLLSRLDPSAVPLLKTIVTGGEPCPKEMPDRWLKDRPGTRFINAYGPCEALYVTSGIFDTPAPCVDVGRANSGIRVYVVDTGGNFAPPGVPGEIVIAGPDVALRYANNALATERAFQIASEALPDGHAESPNTLVYRTGDRGRLSPTGALEFLGRRDGQVKVNGVRIELDEVTSVLRGADAGGNIAVMVHDGNLVAIVESSSAAVTDQLKAYANASLPLHLQPKRILAVGTMPVRINGKIDYKVLTDRLERDRKTRVTTAPANALERKILGLWQMVLGRDDFGVTDNFFALGGNSLDALRLVSAAAKKGVCFTINELFALGTVRALAEITVLAPNVDKKALPASIQDISPIQQHVLKIAEQSGGTAFANGLTALEIRGPLDCAKLDQVWATFATDPAICTAFRKVAGEYESYEASSDTLEIRHHSVCDVAETERTRLCNDIMLDALESAFDLARAPLVNLHCVALGPKRHVIFAVSSSAMLDGHGRMILLHQLADGYISGQQRRIAPSYGNFLAWRTRQPEIGLPDLSDVAPLTIATPQALPRQSQPGRRHYHSFTAPAYDALEHLVVQTGQSRFNILLGAFAALASKYQEGETALIVSPVDQRAASEFADTLGPLTVFQPLALPLFQTPESAAGLGRVAQATAKYLGQRRLACPVETARAAGHTNQDAALPFSRTGFTLIETPPERPQFDGFEVHPWQNPKRSTIFDCYFALVLNGTDLSLTIEYADLAFSEASVATLAAEYEETLIEMAQVVGSKSLNERQAS